MKLLYILGIILAITYTQLRANPTELSLELIKDHEGFVSSVYRDANGYAIGYGTNLSYITKAEAEYLLVSRLFVVDQDLDRRFPLYSNLPYVPKSILQDMVYNMGISRFSTFKKMHTQLSRQNWVKAALEMKASRWFKQTKTRGVYLYNMMRNHKDN